MQEFIGKKVEVRTFETIYRGTLIEIGEEDVHLQSDSGWIVVPIGKIVDIKAVN